MRLQSYGLSHPGYVRKTNDDCFAELLSHNFFVLADGIGSQAGGRLAAELAVRYLTEEIKRNPLFLNQKAPITSLLSAFEQAIVRTHQAIWRYSVENEMAGAMGTTLVALLFIQNHCLIAHIGDSRIYCLRQGQLELLSADDSLVFDLLHYGLIEESEARTFPLKHIITRSLGGQNSLTIQCKSRPVKKDDLFLLCSDGLSGAIDYQQLKAIMVHYSPSLPRTAEALLKAALDAGGFDNISMVLVKPTLE